MQGLLSYWRGLVSGESLVPARCRVLFTIAVLAPVRPQCPQVGPLKEWPQTGQVLGRIGSTLAFFMNASIIDGSLVDLIQIR